MPLSQFTYPFPIDGKFQQIFQGARPAHWKDAATQKGFELIGRAKDRLHVVLGCKVCGAPTLKRVSVVLGHNPECPHCIQARRSAAARAIGAELVGADPKGNRHYGLFRFGCGHTDRRQYHRIEAAAAGGHQASCSACIEDRYAEEAQCHEWQLIGPTVHKGLNYRRYQHVCGHCQDVAVVNMRNGDLDCAGCGETWASKPSEIYILAFTLPTLPVIKLGYSSNSTFRMRQVQCNPDLTRGSLLRKIDVETGHRAICVEKALHSHIRRNRPDLIVPPEIFRDHIRTTSEVYHRHGKPYIEALLDAVESGWDPRGQSAAA